MQLTKTARVGMLKKHDVSHRGYLQTINWCWILSLSTNSMAWYLGNFHHPECHCQEDQKKRSRLNANPESTRIWLAWEKLPTLPSWQKRVKMILSLGTSTVLCVFFVCQNWKNHTLKQKVKEISTENLVTPFNRPNRTFHRTFPSNPRQIADSKNFLCKDAILQVPKRKMMSVTVIIFVEISKKTHTSRQSSYLRISMKFLVLRASLLPLVKRLERNSAHRSLVKFSSSPNTAPRPGESTRKRLRGGVFHQMHLAEKAHQSLGVGCFFWRDRIWNHFLFFWKIYYISLSIKNEMILSLEKKTQSLCWKKTYCEIVKKIDIGSWIV